MKKIMFFVCAATLTVLSACNGGGDSAQWQTERDSVMTMNDQQRQVLDDLTATLVEISSSMDSIAVAEDMLQAANEVPVLTKQQMVSNLSAFKETLASNKTRMEELEKKLSGRNDGLEKLGNILKHLNREIDAKAARINDLLEKLQDANFSIEMLRAEMSGMSNIIGSQLAEIDAQRKAMQSQDAALHTAYYVIGTKKELKDKGLLASRKKVNYGSVEEKLFIKIDIRETKQFEIPGKKAKVLTDMPEDAYSIQSNGDNSVLTITNVDRFWGISNFLIVQTD